MATVKANWNYFICIQSPVLMRWTLISLNRNHSMVCTRPWPLTTTVLWQGCYESQLTFYSLFIMPLVRQRHLFLDKDRIHNAPLNELTKFPYLLPSKHPLAFLIIKMCHINPVVENLIKGKDGLTCAVEIRTSYRKTNWPIAKIHPLEISTNEGDDSATKLKNDTDDRPVPRIFGGGFFFRKSGPFFNEVYMCYKYGMLWSWHAKYADI